MANVYIAEMQTVIPQKYNSEYMADKTFPANHYGDRMNRMVQKLARKYRVDQRPAIIDLEQFPEIKVAEKDHPRNWGSSTINKLTTIVNKEEIGLFSLSYNQTTHVNFVPNLATQMSMDAGLINLEKNEEIHHYGCAGGIYSLEQAINYCRENDKPAIVFTFEQCSGQQTLIDMENPDFKSILMATLLFNDAGVGILIIPERLRHLYSTPLIKIDALETKYKGGDLIYMRDGYFIMGGNVKDIMPPLVSDMLVKPFLQNNMVNKEEVDEWSIHQGGRDVIREFLKPQTLNLSENQLQRSYDLFHEYGNTSAASCLLVLESFFNEERDKKRGKKGIMVGYGAGYYLGAMLYEWN